MPFGLGHLKAFCLNFCRLGNMKMCEYNGILRSIQGLTKYRNLQIESFDYKTESKYDGHL